MTELKTLKTVSQLADEWQEPPARVDYIIRKLRIKPTDRIGIIRLYDSNKAEIIRRGLYNLQIRGDK